ncbi:MAG: Zn-dependent hydrolase [Bacillota bacterium]
MDPERVRQRVEALASFTASPGNGVTRLCFTPEEARAREYVAQCMREAGLNVYTDAAGNMFGRKQGLDPTAPVVMVGSHFDSVRNGGKFDGVAGVVAALEVAHAITQRGITTRHPIEVCALTEEEGSRFGSGLYGSRAMVDGISQEELNRQDSAGVSKGEAMRAFGLDPSRIHEARRRPGDIKAFLELHIEQGPILEQSGKVIGIVDYIVGIRVFKIRVTGSADHAGTTPMSLRRDALVGASLVVAEVERMARELSPNMVATVGFLQVKPGSFNVVPSTVEFTVDMRDPSNSVLDLAEARLKETLERVCSARRLNFELSRTLGVDPVPTSSDIAAMLERHAVKLGLRYMHINSGAGHDAMVMAKIAPIGVVFVPSAGGKSHSPEELTDYNHIAAGARVLMEAVLELAEPS